MINRTNTNNIKSNGAIEAFDDDRPISMYDNLNNVTANMNAIQMTISSTKPKMTKAPTIVNTNTTVTLTATPPTSSKTNGAAHSTPLTDFKINENNNNPQQKHQQLEVNGNRNLNEIPPNTDNAAVYATPYKILAAMPVITNTSPSQTATITETNILTSSPSLFHAIGTTIKTTTATTTTPTATTTATAISSDNFNSFNRPLSQHSQSELNDTSHSIAAVKAALNEAKSKFFGLNGYMGTQQQLQDQQHNYDDNYGDQLPSNVQQHLQQTINNYQAEQQQQQIQQQVQKLQPKYQNIPENSAIFRIQKADSVANSPPDLPPKPLEYQQFQQPSNRSIQTSTPDHNKRMPSGTNTYNQISLNDLDGTSSRSQTVYMATTVPQNIKGNKIAGRHTPTRSSLRHSRMLVVNNKNYEEIQKPNPMGFQQPNLARWLLILQIIIGILLLSLSIWIFFLTPNTPVQDNPYWCGLALLVTGIVGLILIRFQRLKRSKTREHCFMFLRMDSYVLSLLSVLLCCVALIFAAIHYCRLTAPDTKCKSMHLLVEHGSCVCTFNALPVTVNTTEPLLNAPMHESNEDEDEDEASQMMDKSYSIEYHDLSCQEVTGPWTSILGLSFILNSLGFLTSLVFIVLLACCRRPSKRLYTTVRTSTF